MSGKRVHLIGIGGTGLSAIARLLMESGWQVSGSDRVLSPLAEGLQAAGVPVYLEHRPENVAGADLVIRSSAIPDDNVEVQAALTAGIPVLKRSDFLGQIMADRVGIAVAGSHGKTTTTAMITWVLSAMGEDPSFILGGISNNLGVNARAGNGRVFVIEADEYDYMFLGLRPRIAVVTNVEYDHPDCFATPEIYYQAFLQFVGQVTPNGTLLVCGDDAGAARLFQDMQGRRLHTLAYGIRSVRHDYYAENLQHNQIGGYTFDVIWSRPAQAPERLCSSVTLQVPGEHNVLNALASLAVAHQLELPLCQAAQALENFRGTGRRFEVRGEAQGITVIDDYGHHPSEIRVTLAAARSRYPGRRLWAVWQPHTYSRTRALLASFALAFEQADEVLVTEIYAAREAPPRDGFSARQVVQAIKHPQVHFAPDLARATTYLLEHLQSGDVLLVFSAGDADRISANVLAAFGERRPSYASNKFKEEDYLSG